MNRKNEIDKVTQKAIDKAGIKSLFKMLYKKNLVDREEFEKLLECTDRKFEDDNLQNRIIISVIFSVSSLDCNITSCNR